MLLAPGLLLRREGPAGLARCRDRAGRERGEVPREARLAMRLFHLGLRQRPLPPPRALCHSALEPRDAAGDGAVRLPRC
eukprot:9394007-Alexandrium_andersonii.AAC.1